MPKTPILGIKSPNVGQNRHMLGKIHQHLVQIATILAKTRKTHRQNSEKLVKISKICLKSWNPGYKSNGFSQPIECSNICNEFKHVQNYYNMFKHFNVMICLALFWRIRRVFLGMFGYFWWFSASLAKCGGDFLKRLPDEMWGPAKKYFWGQSVFWGKFQKFQNQRSHEGGNLLDLPDGVPVLAKTRSPGNSAPRRFLRPGALHSTWNCARSPNLRSKVARTYWKNSNFH